MVNQDFEMAAIPSSFPGTPDERTWPGVTSLPDYKSTFPKWSKQDIGHVIPALEPDAKDLLSVSRFFPTRNNLS